MTYETKIHSQLLELAPIPTKCRDYDILDETDTSHTALHRNFRIFSDPIEKDGILCDCFLLKECHPDQQVASLKEYHIWFSHTGEVRHINEGVWERDIPAKKFRARPKYWPAPKKGSYEYDELLCGISEMVDLIISYQYQYEDAIISTISPS